MSDRPCNFCNLKELERQARSSGQRITRIPATWGMGGEDVYMHPKNINVRKLKEKERKPYFKAWFMEVGTQCAC